MESIQLVLGLGPRGFANWQTTGHDRKRGSNVEIKGALDIRSILAREDRPGMDCLALRDWDAILSVGLQSIGAGVSPTHVRMLLVRGLRRGQPLQRRAFLCSFHGDL